MPEDSFESFESAKWQKTGRPIKDSDTWSCIVWIDKCAQFKVETTKEDMFASSYSILFCMRRRKLNPCLPHCKQVFSLH